MGKESLIEDRSRLIDKKFNGGLTEKEDRQLKIIQWQLDRLENSEFVNNKIVGLVLNQERLAQDIKNFLNDMGING